jgi:hypothetical protein
MKINRDKRFLNIDGWFSSEAASLFVLANRIQKRRGIKGDIFEIGCHHGRSAFLLGQMVRPSETLGVCDLFGEQQENVSGSGKGNRQIFLRNMKPLTKNGLDLSVFQGVSQKLTKEEIGERYRFFHVDGGHNIDEALADLRLAAKSTLDEGVIAVDDPFRAEWPGVTVALIEFLDKSEFRPVVVGFNKILLARNKHANMYISKIINKEKRSEYGLDFPWRLKEMKFLNNTLYIFYLDSGKTNESFPSFMRKYYRTRKNKMGYVKKLILRILISIS